MAGPHKGLAALAAVVLVLTAVAVILFASLGADGGTRSTSAAGEERAGSAGEPLHPALRHIQDAVADYRQAGRLGADERKFLADIEAAALLYRETIAPPFPVGEQSPASRAAENAERRMEAGLSGLRETLRRREDEINKAGRGRASAEDLGAPLR